MINVVGIQLQKNGEIYYFDANNLDVHPGEYVIAETARGLDLGEVAVGVREVDESSAQAPIRKLIRIATEQDIQHSTENRDKEREAYTICQKKIEEHQLDMKLVSVEYAFDNSKILFYFTANGRVDFRSLVKDLASVFKMRIELRQIGVRDEAKMLGGLGPCGRPICCGAFLDQFQPVSIKMAKEQNLSLNPTKISGVCGRLMCCLKYEQDHYEQTRKRMPRVGREVSTPNGIGTVSDLNIVKETVMVRITNGDSSEIREFALEDIARVPEDGTAASRSRRRDIPDNPKDDEKTDNSNDEADAMDDAEKNPAEPEVTEAAVPPRGKAKNGIKTEAGRDNTKDPGTRSAARNGHQLGKPVRRENPNRGKNGKTAGTPAQGKSTAATDAEKQTAQKSDSTETLNTETRNNGSWAEALQKAMDAIN